jgi:pimeloyl-ACP methyl ester carboxylesterase
MVRTFMRGAMLCALLCPAAAFATLPAPTLHLRPLMFRLADGSEIETDRGTISVPEDRNDPTSRPIDIGFIRFRSTNPHPGAPIVYLAGGPGGSGVGAANGPRQPIFLALRAVADVIALDQRGVGMSNHLPECQAAHRLDPALVLSEQTLTAYYRETLQACSARWRAAGVAVGGYDTEQSADDLEDLRRALGAARVDLWGISYGTHLALAMMRRHPRSVGRAALSSMEGLSQTVKLPAHVDAAFARIETVAASGLTARMRRVHARFDAAPQAFTIIGAGPAGGSVSVRTDSFILRMMAGLLAKDPDGIPRLAGAYAALDAGHGEALAPLIYDYFYRRPLTVGMAELMDGASGISDARLAVVQRQAPSSLLGTATNFPMPQLRGAVAGLDLGDGFRREIRSNLPVLLFEGDLDVRTPLEEQAVATAGLANAHRILVHNGGHDLFESHPDVAGLLVAFFSGQPVTVTDLTLAPPAR